MQVEKIYMYCTQIDEYWPSISVYVYNIITLW